MPYPSDKKYKKFQFLITINCVAPCLKKGIKSLNS